VASVTVRRGDLYEVLGVSRAASTDEIATAFRAQAKALHPDRNPGDALAAEHFKDLTLAYQTLIRPRSRAAYDRRHVPAPAVTERADAVSPIRRDPLFRTPGRARAAIVAGVLLFLAGAASAVLLGIVDTGDTGETVTLWIAAAKLLVCGPVLAGAGLLRLQRIATGQ
jgi:hypothetical protein